MPACDMQLPTYERRLWDRVNELEWLIDNRPASPAQREAWIEELELIDEEIAES